MEDFEDEDDEDEREDEEEELFEEDDEDDTMPDSYEPIFLLFLCLFSFYFYFLLTLFKPFEPLFLSQLTSLYFDPFFFGLNDANELLSELLPFLLTLPELDLFPALFLFGHNGPFFLF